MKGVSVGQKVADSEFICTDSHLHRFSDLLGKNIVLYFYPKDNTPGCTRESKDFTEMCSKFEELDTQILGVSRDSLVCHQKFQMKHTLSFPLISDPEEVLCRYFNVIIEKNMFKRILLGIERSTFLIDKEGIVREIWRNVRVKDHAQKVYEAVSKLVKPEQV